MQNTENANFGSLMPKKILVLLVQLGSPKSPKVSDVRDFLKRFLSDPRVVDINPLLWKIILNCFVLPFRPKKSAALYRRIWDGSSFPLIENTKSFANKVNKYTDERYDVRYGFLLTSPDLGDLLDHWQINRKDYERLIVIPQFPQYSESTIASGYDAWNRELDKRVIIPDFTFVSHYHRLKCFIDLSAQKINDEIAQHRSQGVIVDDLIISFHGIPLRRVVQKNDPYFEHCGETYELIKNKIQTLDPKRIHLCFQSRFGSEVWLGPYTDEYAVNLCKEKPGSIIAVHSPSFVADCLETTDELGHELKEEVHEHGGELLFIGSLNDDDQWAKGYAEYIEALSKREEKELFYNEELSIPKRPQMSKKDEPMSDFSKKTIKIVFLTLFLDLVGFSIIFPIFPALANHYMENDPNNYFLKLIFESIQSLLSFNSQGSVNPIVLFGGALGALYSLLQFVAAPLWGSLSDKYGRKPTLFISVAGLAFSYLLWFFSSSFTMLIIARIVGGLMGGNISIASAVVADVTDEHKRSKGMAYIGIAFALGFIIGPAIGGLLSLIDLSNYLSIPGINPFSTIALFAFLLSSYNLYLIATKFKETLPPKVRGQSKSLRSANIFKIFRPLPFPGVNLTNLGYFIFIAAFSGMEFTLTFLVVERLSYSSLDNAYMFIFIGLIIAVVQGGIVRRRASDVGEKRMSILGMVFVIPGLVLIGVAENSFFIYFGLFFLACGSAMIIPCLTSLVSLYTPKDQQGRALGVFRSLGALGRVIGPIFASIIYWTHGPSAPYFIGAVFLLVPILLISRLDQPLKQ